MLFLTVLVLIIFLAFPGLCQLYGIIVGAFKIFSGIGAAFSGQLFSAQSVTVSMVLGFEDLPFEIINLPLSMFCLGWGLLVASRQSRSAIGFLLGATNVLAGASGLFYVSHATSLTLPGFWEEFYP